MFKTIQPVPVERHDDGLWFHPDFFKPANDNDYPQPGEFAAWLEQNRVSYAEIWLEGDPAADELTKAHEAGDKGAWLRWTPPAPDGDGWYLVAVYEEEDGPLSIWLRPIELDPPALTAMIQRHHAEALIEDCERTLAND